MLISFPDRNLSFFISHKRIGGFARFSHATIVVVEDNEGNRIARGVAKCTREDPWRRRLGVQLAMARAMRAAGLARCERSIVWRMVWNKDTPKVDHAFDAYWGSRPAPTGSQVSVRDIALAAWKAGRKRGARKRAAIS